MPMSKHSSRRLDAFNTRLQATSLAFCRPHPEHKRNDDEIALIDIHTGEPTYIATFTKGLPHDPSTGLLARACDFETFTQAIASGLQENIAAIPLGPLPGLPTDPDNPPPFASAMAQNDPVGLRAWESMAAGLTFDLEGPDAQAVTMPPAPALNSAELAFEMTEVYWMALLRDVPFSTFSQSPSLVTDAIRSLNAQPWTVDPRGSYNSTYDSISRARPAFNTGTVFRGVLPGDHQGPYISQFLLAGTKERGGGSGTEANGFINYGSVRIDQRVRVARPRLDYMTTWGAWLDVQNGADVRERELYVDEDPIDKRYRFITTPRDLATYVHYDALYEAYLNACLILLEIKAKFDPNLPFQQPDAVDKQTGFATFGPPHILSLVTEVATRALKAVRYQKFNIHRRPRPEVLGARIDYLNRGEADKRFNVVTEFSKTVDSEVLHRIYNANQKTNAKVCDRGIPRSQDDDVIPGKKSEGTFLLPMAFAEGSPMHPSYGAGHATVAGACVTVLKAFFDTDQQLSFAFEPNEDGSKLLPVCLSTPLTVGGELNKVCSNISIGRNWAGVHYYSDYIDSVRMGEEIAIGILEEQKLTFGETFSMKLERFDGSTIFI